MSTETALLIGCLVLLVVLLVRQSLLTHQQSKDRLEREHSMAMLGNQILDDLDAQHDVTVDSLQQTNQNLMSTLTQMGQSQSALLESMQRQVLLSTRNQEEKINALRLENERQLAEMRKTVDQRLSESLDKKLDTSFAQVSERLESVYKGLGEMHTLASGVGDLKKVLTNVKTRGIWGEMQLANLIRQALAPGQYEENVAVVPGSAERVEFAVCLPDQSGGTVYLPVDSKFPQEDYLRLVDASQAGDAAGADAARKALDQRLRSEAKKIASKYISPPHTTDFAIMFLPIEGLYSEALQSPDLVESLQREYRVVIAGPGTFSAMLNALQMGFRTMAIEKRSGEVWHLLGEIKTDFARFADMLEATRRRLDQAGESIDSAVSR
ncbi:MAG: DNA recombination protein RmuC, partial [Clostridiales bacterium]|nr:DNA recombination protein RmuC [Clostridiales bacterium]